MLASPPPPLTLPVVPWLSQGLSPVLHLLTGKHTPSSFPRCVADSSPLTSVLHGFLSLLIIPNREVGGAQAQARGPRRGSAHSPSVWCPVRPNAGPDPCCVVLQVSRVETC